MPTIRGMSTPQATPTTTTPRTPCGAARIVFNIGYKILAQQEHADTLTQGAESLGVYQNNYFMM